MASLELTHTKLAQLLAFSLNYGRTGYADLSASQKGVVDQVIDSGYRALLYPPAMDGKARHRWSFLWPETTLTLSESYDTGTITVTADAGGSIVTGASTAWDGVADLVSYADNWELTPNADSTYAVKQYDNATQILLEDTAVTVAAGTSYSLGRVEYDLASDFGGFQGQMTYRPEASTCYDPIQFTSWGIIRRLRQLNGAATMRPKRCCLLAKAHDETAVQGWKLVFDYQSDSAYVLNYKYKVNADALDATNLYPVCGVMHSETLLASCLYAAARFLNEDQAKIEDTRRHFLERLQASIAEDEAMVPETVGYMRDDSEDALGRRYSRHHDVGVYPKFEGSVYY